MCSLNHRVKRRKTEVTKRCIHLKAITLSINTSAPESPGRRGERELPSAWDRKAKCSSYSPSSISRPSWLTSGYTEKMWMVVVKSPEPCDGCLCSAKVSSCAFRFPSVYFISTHSKFSYSLVYCWYLLSPQCIRSVNMLNNWLVTRIISFICLISMQAKYCGNNTHLPVLTGFWDIFLCALKENNKDLYFMNKL